MKHVKAEVSTLAFCCSIKRRDGVSINFTSADFDIKIDGITYKSNSGSSPTAIINTADTRIDNFDIEGIISSDFIEGEDIKAGMYDYAEVVIFLVDYLNPEAQAINSRIGWFGEVQVYGSGFITEIRGLRQVLSKNLGNPYSPLCRAIFCDQKCGLNVNEFTVEASVEVVLGKTTFSIAKNDKPNGYYSNGKLEFLSGQNKGYVMEIKNSFSDNTTSRTREIELMLPMPYGISANDRVLLTAGCDKHFNTCVKKYKNAINFRGEPHIPIPERML